jgi:hypothetical protein
MLPFSGLVVVLAGYTLVAVAVTQPANDIAASVAQKQHRHNVGNAKSCRSSLITFSQSALPL